MSLNPYEGEERGRGWAMGFASGFYGPEFSVPPPAILTPHLMETFSEGQLAGQQAAIDGIDMSLAGWGETEEPPPTDFGGAIFVGKALKLAIDVSRSVLYGGVNLLLLLMSVAVHFRYPMGEMQKAGQQLADDLTYMGLDPTNELFIALAFDGDQPPMQYRLGQIYKDYEQAEAAAMEAGAAHWLVIRWRPDLPTLVDIVHGDGTTVEN
jgi:hypothetical protein